MTTFFLRNPNLDRDALLNLLLALAGALLAWLLWPGPQGG